MTRVDAAAAVGANRAAGAGLALAKRSSAPALSFEFETPSMSAAAAPAEDQAGTARVSPDGGSGGGGAPVAAGRRVRMRARAAAASSGQMHARKPRRPRPQMPPHAVTVMPASARCGASWRHEIQPGGRFSRPARGCRTCGRVARVAAPWLMVSRPTRRADWVIAIAGRRYNFQAQVMMSEYIIY